MTTPVPTRIAPLEERVADLLSRMSLEEKVAQLRTGIVARRGNKSESRLGIPELIHDEVAPCGTGAGVPAFPQAIALASSWDPPLLREVHAALARELHARGVRLVHSPLLDVARDPRRGCIERTFGEDPYLVGEMGVAVSLWRRGACRRGTSGGNGPPVSERELRGLFPRSRSHPAHRPRGAHAFAQRHRRGSALQRWLLRDVLRGEWEFGGAVVSGPGAVGGTGVHRVAAGRRSRVLPSKPASMPPGGRQHQKRSPAVRAGGSRSRGSMAPSAILALSSAPDSSTRHEPGVARFDRLPAAHTQRCRPRAARSRCSRTTARLSPLRIAAQAQDRRRLAGRRVGAHRFAPTRGRTGVVPAGARRPSSTARRSPRTL
jgi:hypothetical protein